jgi:hypothetical protein
LHLWVNAAKYLISVIIEKNPSHVRIYNAQSIAEYFAFAIKRPRPKKPYSKPYIIGCSENTKAFLIETNSTDCPIGCPDRFIEELF